MTRPERAPDTATARDGPAAPYLVPGLPDVVALLDAAERVLDACARADDAHTDRTVRLASAVDPCTLPLRAVVGPGVPVPLGGGTASRALRRLADVLRPVLHTDPGTWTAADATRLVPFRAVRIDTTDLAILGQAGAQLSHPRRSREGALGSAVASLSPEPGEPPDDRHPAAIGCLLAVLVPVVDPVALSLHAVAAAHGRGDPVALDPDALSAHREVSVRLLARLHRAR